MKLSIITINLNNREGLLRTILSVKQQSCKNFEWILIDGGSSDGSQLLIEQYKNDFTFFCSEKDKGIYNAMNKGISHSNSDYSLFLNSGDELYDKSTIAKVLPILDKSDADICYGDCFLSGKNNSYYHKSPSQLSIFKIFLNSICHPSTFIKTTLLKESPYDENLRIASDLKCWISSWISKKKFSYIELIVSKFYLDGISSTDSELVNIERKKIAEELLPRGLYSDIEDYISVKNKVVGLEHQLNSASVRLFIKIVNKCRRLFIYTHLS